MWLRFKSMAHPKSFYEIRGERGKKATFWAVRRREVQRRGSRGGLSPRRRESSEAPEKVRVAPRPPDYPTARLLDRRTVGPRDHQTTNTDRHTTGLPDEGPGAQPMPPERVHTNHGVGNSRQSGVCGEWYCATPDGDTYPHMLAPTTVELLHDQTGPRRLVNAVSRYFPDRPVYGRDWSPSPQEFVRLLEMPSGTPNR